MSGSHIKIYSSDQTTEKYGGKLAPDLMSTGVQKVSIQSQNFCQLTQQICNIISHLIKINLLKVSCRDTVTGYTSIYVFLNRQHSIKM